MVAPVKNGNAYRGHAGGGGGRPYGLMLLVALGAAILGVTVLHKLREGRLFSLLVKEKDHELLSLHLLLQREHEFSKEAQKKLQEMKANLYTIKAQKSEMEGRLLEVQSLVSSLKDEQKIVEAQLEEKRTEIKMLRQQQMTPSGDIREAPIQKEGEIDDLKGHSEKPISVWSVSSDDPSNSTINPQNEVTDGSKNETDTSKQEQRKLEDTYKNGKQRKLRRKKWRDLIRRFGSEKNGHSEHKDALSKETMESKGQGKPVDKAEPDPDSSLNDNAETKTLSDPDSSARKEEVESFLEEDSKEIEKDSDKVEEEEEANSSKDEEVEHETN